VAAVLGGPLCVAQGQIAFDDQPIGYAQARPTDPIARLQKRIDAGELELEHDARWGYLPSLLDALGVPRTSQGLVFSKTSFQLKRITPTTPRAVYFGDDIYIGSVQLGEVLEISAVDPQLGGVFYTLDQQRTDWPQFQRRRHECLQCHASPLTQGVPGHVVRSVFPDREGFPVLRAGNFVTSHESPLEERWGGWYVTGLHGDQRHMGNVTIPADGDRDQLDREAGANLTDLSHRIDAAPYLTPHSDLVALMVLEHQTQMHNAITQANYQTLFALRDQRVMDRLLERPDGEYSETTMRRVAGAGESLLRYLLFVGETRLTSPVEGTSGFAAEFSERGPRDTRGRSLRELDLQRRLFRYPCSYLVHSAAFDGLPAVMREYIYQRLLEILEGTDRDGAFRHLTADDRRAIREILLDTKPEFREFVASVAVR
jgi:hypothetical protein